jgi:hypothetical protein
MGRRARSSTPARRQPPRLRAFAILLVALRILVSLAVFQVSELGHFGVELAEHVGLIVHAHDEDDAREEEPGHDCPPGCPKCHHVHASNASLTPWMTPPAPLAAMLDIILAEFPTVAEAPRGPPLPSLFRPPRRHSAST